MKEANFSQLDLGTAGPIGAKMETIVVDISASDMVEDYAIAFVKEADRVNPLLAQQVGLTEQQMIDYAKFLLVQRIKSVHNECTLWRQLKVLYIPVFLQYAMRMVGKVIIRDLGLTLVPEMDDDDTIEYSEALKISDLVGAFQKDLQIVQDAMPRGIYGDESVMGTALVAGYVRSIKRVNHVSDTYISAFLNMKLREEQAFAVLYRVQYDDVEFIRAALTSRKEIF